MITTDLTKRKPQELQINVITKLVACEHNTSRERASADTRRESRARHGSTQSQRQDPRKHLFFRQEGKKLYTCTEDIYRPFLDYNLKVSLRFLMFTLSK